MSEAGIRARGIAPYLFILPLAAGIGIFGFGCLVYVCKLSLTRTDLMSSEYVGLRNYFLVLFENKWFLTSLFHTMYYALWVVPLNLCLGLGLALVTYQRMKFGTLFRCIFLLPWISSVVITALVFRYIFNPEWGILNWFLGLLGIGKIMWTEHYSCAIPAVAIMNAWQSMGFGMIVFLGGINSIPRQIFEAADLDGATELKKFWHVTVPLLKPTIFFYLAISVIFAFQVFDSVYAFIEGARSGGQCPELFTSPILVCSYTIYTMGFSLFTFGQASAMAVMMFLVVFLIIMLQRHFLGRTPIF